MKFLKKYWIWLILLGLIIAFVFVKSKSSANDVVNNGDASDKNKPSSGNSASNTGGEGTTENNKPAVFPKTLIGRSYLSVIQQYMNLYNILRTSEVGTPSQMFSWMKTLRLKTVGSGFDEKVQDAWLE